MKCENCGKEATFYYSSTVNGVHEEHCYCAGCAREAGFEGVYESALRPMGLPGFGGEFAELFAPMRFALPVGDFGVPLLRAVPVRRAARPQSRGPALSEAEARIPGDAGAAVREQRERAALRQELEEAVRGENYERAAELRDRLRQMEG